MRAQSYSRMPFDPSPAACGVQASAESSSASSAGSVCSRPSPSTCAALLQTQLVRGVLGLSGEEWTVSDFKGRHFEGEIVLWAVPKYCRYGVSYRDLEQMMGERGVSVDHSTIYRWVQKYAPEIESLRWQWRQPKSTSWRMDETYIKVRGQWPTFTEPSTSSAIRSTSISRRRATPRQRSDSSGKALKGLKHRELLHVINTDKAPTYAVALAELKKEGKCPEDTVHRQAKFSTEPFARRVIAGDGARDEDSRHSRCTTASNHGQFSTGARRPRAAVSIRISRKRVRSSGARASRS